MAADGDTASVHYTGTLDDGAEFDSSRDREPLSFTLGKGSLISGFEDAVRGLAVGDTVTVRLEPADAYGERNDDLILEVPVNLVPEGVNVGDRLQLPNGSPAIVLNMTAEIVTLDANPSLAGQALTFSIELITLVKAES
jgi:peptidylprolyl isomerase